MKLIRVASTRRSVENDQVMRCMYGIGAPL